MGLIESIKEKFGIGGSGGSDPDMSIANEYREIQPEEIRDEGRGGIISHDEGKFKGMGGMISHDEGKFKGMGGMISHDEGKFKPMDTDSRERYYAKQAISKRRKEAPKLRRQRVAEENKEIIKSAVSGAGHAVVRGTGHVVGKVGRRVSELGSEYVAEPIREVGSRIFDTRQEQEIRVLERKEKARQRKTFGMTGNEQAGYDIEYKKAARKAAEEKARRDAPQIGETAKQRTERLLKEKREEREIGLAYRKAKATAAGRAEISERNYAKKAKKEGQGTVAPENPMLGMGGLVPHGFLPPGQGSGAPGFTGYSGGGSPGFRPNMNLRPVGFEQPQAPPAPQPERRMSRFEQHRQQVREDTEKWKREQQQQYFQQNVYYPFAPQPLPSHNGTRNQPQREARPQFINLFEGHQPTTTNNIGNGSNKQSMPKMVNLFERQDIPTNTKIGGHQPHPLAEFSASLLGIDSIGTSKNGKKKHVKAPWE